MVRPWERRSHLLHHFLAMWFLCAVAGWRGPSQVAAVAAANPVEAVFPGEHPAGGIRLGRRQAPTAIPPAAPVVALPSGWVMVGEKPKPTTTSAARAAQPTPPRDPGQLASSAASPTPPGTVSVEAGKQSSAQNAVASPPAEGGIKSPIQHRPLPLVLSMPFAVAGLGLNLVLFFLVLRGSAAVGYESRKAIQAARMAKGGRA